MTADELRAELRESDELLVEANKAPRQDAETIAALGREVAGYRSFRTGLGLIGFVLFLLGVIVGSYVTEWLLP
jgi:hypothetical protein